MSEMTDLIGQASFEFEGKSYVLKVRDFAVEAAFTAFVEENALRKINAHQATMDAAIFQNLLDGWRRDCACAVYEFGSECSVRAMVSPSGARELAWLELKRHNPGLDRETVERIFKDDGQSWLDEIGVIQWKRRPAAVVLSELLRKVNAPNFPKGATVARP